jgi:hypothetical protein
MLSHPTLRTWSSIVSDEGIGSDLRSIRATAFLPVPKTVCDYRPALWILEWSHSYCKTSTRMLIELRCYQSCEDEVLPRLQRTFKPESHALDSDLDGVDYFINWKDSNSARGQDYP